MLEFQHAVSLLTTPAKNPHGLLGREQKSTAICLLVHAMKNQEHAKVCDGISQSSFPVPASSFSQSHALSMKEMKWYQAPTSL